MQTELHSLETLESRRLLSSANLAGPSLFIRGDGNVNNTIDVSLDNTGSNIQVVINGGSPQLFDRSQVHQIYIRTYTGDDTIVVDPAVNKDTWVFSGEGNDNITTGPERDFIYSDGGNDTISAGDGKNWIISGAGDDNVTSGGGMDRIWSGAGNDTVNSGGGNDNVSAAGGDDSVDGGDGNDRLYGGDGTDTLLGEAGDDRLWGQGGNDQILGGAGNDILGGIVGANNTLLGGAGKDTFYVKTSLDGQVNDFNSAEDVLHLQPQDDGSSQN